MTLTGIRRAILEERGGPGGSWPWTLRFVEAADRQFAGRWRLASLDAAAAERWRVAPHAGEPCRGDRRVLVGTGGATVGDAAAELARVASVYAVENPSCWSRLETAACAPFSTVVLAAARPDVAEFDTVPDGPGAWFVLDGFHRLVAWSRAGRLVPGSLLRAFIVGG